MEEKGVSGGRCAKKLVCREGVIGVQDAKVRKPPHNAVPSPESKKV